MIALLLGLALAEEPEEQTRSWFVGAQLAVTAEPFEDDRIAVSLNVLPVVLEWAFHDRVGVRLTSLLNLQFAGADTGLAHRGVAITVPVYLPGPKDRAPYQGFYVGPHAGFTVNPLVSGRDLTGAAELGVRWQVFEHASVNLAGQFGATWLDRPRPVDSRWVSHLGVYPSFGVWFR